MPLSHGGMLARLSIGRRLLLSFAAVTLLMALGSAVAVRQLVVMQEQAARLDLVDRQAAAVLRLHANVLALRDKLQRAAEARDADRFAREVDVLRARVLEAAAEAERALGAAPEEARRHRRLLDSLSPVGTSLGTQLETIRDLALAGDWPAAQLRLDHQTRSAAQLTADLVEALDAVVAEDRRIVLASIRSTQRRAQLTLLAATVATVAAAWLLGMVVRRSIVRPLGALSAGARALAGGDFEHRVSVDGGDELIDLGRVFNETSSQLQLLYEARQRNEADLRASLKEKEVLLREIHHRVKNNLQVVSSLLNLQVGHIEDPRARRMFEESQNRVKSMALIHEQLCQSNDLARIDMAKYIEGLTASLVHSFDVDPARVRVTTRIADVLLGIDVAVPCALLVNELVSNALEHAFPRARTGELRVDLQSSENGDLTLTVSDDGVGLPAGLDLRSPPSLGLRLVTTLAEQLDAALELDRSAGTTFRMRFAEPKRKAPMPPTGTAKTGL